MTATLLRARPATPLGVSLRRLDSLVSPYTGVVGAVHEILVEPYEARLPKVSCELAEDQGILGRGLEHLRGGGGGSGRSRGEARAAAIGEAVERYSASWVPEEELVLGSAHELGPGAVEPERFALFHERQHASRRFPFRPFTRHTPVRWTRGFALPDGAPVHLPVQLTLFADPPAVDGEVPIAYATSNGMACGATLEEALESGLLELIERDAFMLAWTNRLSLPRLDWSGHPGLVELDRRYFAPTGAAYAAVDLSAFFGVPVVAGVVAGGGDVAALGVGASAAAMVERAWLKALAEAFSVRTWATAMRAREPHPDFGEDFAGVQTFADHIHFYSLQANARRAGFLGASERLRPVGDVAPLPGETPLERVEALCRRIEERGGSVYAADITAPDVRAAGLRVAKVVAPELCPLDVPYGARFLGGSRLYRAAAELGLGPVLRGPGELNPDPHPFP